MPDAQFITILSLGFVLGARHALDADHIAAVSTILSRRPTFGASGFIGFCWGFGHTAVLLLVGLVVIALKITIPEALAQVFEFGVGVMLVVLGASLALAIAREGWHLHAHEHDGERHLHLHSHQLRPDHTHRHWLRRSLQPLCVGMVHGLAGSAALMLMVLSTVRTLWEGVAYILVFGVGSILGMMLLGLVISLPLVLSASFGRRAQMTVQGLASLGSIGLGLAMMVRIGLGEGLF
ncbi:MAG: urease accessory protein UreH [Nitrospirae bacterium]|nr:MAG: urease accessory protein UreH [Nitrospirota bacterium]